MSHDQTAELIAACEDISRQIVLKSHAMAAKLGLSPSDFEHLSLLIKQGPMTAGHVATLTGLTTGAITGIIDRLEELGFVKRQSDSNDRRRIIIVPTSQATKKIQAFHKKSDADFERCIANFSAHDVEMIITFLNRTNQFLQQETAKFK